MSISSLQKVLKMKCLPCRIIGSFGTPSKLVLDTLKSICAKFGAFVRSSLYRYFLQTKALKIGQWPFRNIRGLRAMRFSNISGHRSVRIPFEKPWNSRDSMENSPWNSMEDQDINFHGIPWKFLHRFPWKIFAWRIRTFPMEFHGKHQETNFHAIPWKFLYRHFPWRIRPWKSSMSNEILRYLRSPKCSDYLYCTASLCLQLVITEITSKLNFQCLSQ